MSASTAPIDAWFVIILRGDREQPQIHYGARPTPKKQDIPKRRFLGNPVRIEPEHIQDHHMDVKKLNEIYRPKAVAS